MEQAVTQESKKKESRIAGILGKYYIIALIVGGGAILLFTFLASEVLENEVVRFNTNILLRIHAHRSPSLDSIAMAFTNLGSVLGVMICSALFIGLLLIRKERLKVYTFVLVIAGAAILMAIMKIEFHQARPHVFQPLVVESTFSFPSGHSLLSFTLWGFVAWWLISINPRQILRWVAGVIMIGIAACVAMSRLYLGVHWPTDVMAGLLVAAFWVSVCVMGHEWMVERTNRRSAGSIAKGDTPVTPKSAP